MNGPIYIAVYVVDVLFMTMYALNQERHQEILVELEERRAANAED
jgi:Na+/melibiose symporter-like transporter